MTADAFDFSAPTVIPDGVAAQLGELLEPAVARAGLLATSMLRVPCTLRYGGAVRLHGRADDIRFGVGLGDAGVGLAALDQTFVLQLADLLLGGPGLSTTRTPSPLEVELVARRLGDVLAPIAIGLAPLGVTALQVRAFADVPSPGDLIAALLEVSLGAVDGAVALGIPRSLLDAEAHEPPIDPAMAAALGDVDVPVTVRFEPVHLPVVDVEGLAVGDVIRLEHPYGHPLTGFVDNRPFFLARPGRHGRSLAVRIEHVIAGDSR